MSPNGGSFPKESILVVMVSVNFRCLNWIYQHVSRLMLLLKNVALSVIQIIQVSITAVVYGLQRKIRKQIYILQQSNYAIVKAQQRKLLRTLFNMPTALNQ